MLSIIFVGLNRFSFLTLVTYATLTTFILVSIILQVFMTAVPSQYPLSALRMPDPQCAIHKTSKVPLSLWKRDRSPRVPRAPRNSGAVGQQVEEKMVLRTELYRIQKVEAQDAPHSLPFHLFFKVHLQSPL